MPFGMLCNYAEQVMEFLHGIGLPVEIEAGSTGFIDHVAVVNGGLRVDPRAPASGLLHEAGHLAVVPAQFRHLMNGDLEASMDLICSKLAHLNLEPDSPLDRAVMQSGETEATAWSWAAGKAIGLPDKQIIKTSEYGGDGGNIRLALSACSYFGINGLAAAGFCVRRRSPYRPLPVYPELAYWLQK